MSEIKYLIPKVEYVKTKLTEAILPVAPHIESLEYVVFQNVNHETWTDEWLVVHYKGGAVQARTCDGDSLGAILEEAVGMMWSSQSNRRGGNDTSFYKEHLDMCREDYERPEYRKRRVKF